MAAETGGNENEGRKDKEVWKYLPTLLLSISFIGVGVYLTINNLVIVGTNSRTLQPTAKGGELYFVVGLIFLVVTYYSISPFSPLRQFIEGKTRIKKKKKVRRHERTIFCIMHGLVGSNIKITLF